jgi:hypothetical protein
LPVHTPPILILLLALAGCAADDLQQKKKTRDAEKQEASRTASDGQVEDEEDAQADQPVPVSGTYLTCVSLEKSETYHVGADSSVFGCDVKTGAGDRVSIVPEKSTIRLVLGNGETLAPVIAAAKMSEAPFQVFFSVSKTVADTIKMIGLSTVTKEGSPLELEQSFILKHISDPEYLAANYFSGILYDAIGGNQNHLPPKEQKLAPITAAMKHLMFATQKVYSANVGVAGADKICDTAGKRVDPKREWLAILSTSTRNARDRFTISGPVHNVMGELLAQDSAGFWSGTLAAEPKYTEFGQDLDEYIVKALGYKMSRAWTGSKADGTYNAAKGTCLDWTVDAFEIGAGIGKSNSTDSQWIDKTEDVPCNHLGRFYCISR